MLLCHICHHATDFHFDQIDTRYSTFIPKDCPVQLHHIRARCETIELTCCQERHSGGASNVAERRSLSRFACLVHPADREGREGVGVGRHMACEVEKE
jgi:hypothetical protein